jgi:hypothetical protein
MEGRNKRKGKEKEGQHMERSRKNVRAMNIISTISSIKR